MRSDPMDPRKKELINQFPEESEVRDYLEENHLKITVQELENLYSRVSDVIAGLNEPKQVQIDKVVDQYYAEQRKFEEKQIFTQPNLVTMLIEAIKTQEEEFLDEIKQVDKQNIPKKEIKRESMDNPTDVYLNLGLTNIAETLMQVDSKASHSAIARLNQAWGQWIVPDSETLANGLSNLIKITNLLRNLFAIPGDHGKTDVIILQNLNNLTFDDDKTDAFLKEALNTFKQDPILSKTDLIKNTVETRIQVDIRHRYSSVTENKQTDAQAGSSNELKKLEIAEGYMDIMRLKETLMAKVEEHKANDLSQVQKEILSKLTKTWDEAVRELDRRNASTDEYTILKSNLVNLVNLLGDVFSVRYEYAKKIEGIKIFGKSFFEKSMNPDKELALSTTEENIVNMINSRTLSEPENLYKNILTALKTTSVIGKGHGIKHTFSGCVDDVIKKHSFLFPKHDGEPDAGKKPKARKNG